MNRVASHNMISPLPSSGVYSRTGHPLCGCSFPPTQCISNFETSGEDDTRARRFLLLGLPCPVDVGAIASPRY